MASQFTDIDLIIIFFSEIAVFFLSSVVTGPNFMSISLLDLELRQFFIYKGVIRKPEIGNNLV